MGAHDRIPPIQQTPGKSTVTFAGGAFRNSTLRPDHESRPPVGPPLHAREALGPPPLFRSDPHVGDHPGLATPTLHRRHHRRLPSTSISPPERGERSIDPPPPTAGRSSPAKKRVTSTVEPKAAALGVLVPREKPKIIAPHRREAEGKAPASTSHHRRHAADGRWGGHSPQLDRPREGRRRPYILIRPPLPREAEGPLPRERLHWPFPMPRDLCPGGAAGGGGGRRRVGVGGG
jgi:hypothetical protein